jgi:peptidoglycan/LPS O-acetylase OafA/YrhL
MTLEASKSFFDFAWRRFARIWPGYMLSALVIFVAMYALGFAPYQRGLYDLAIAPFLWAPALGGSYVSGVYWSLVVEIRFYALIAVLYFGLGAQRFRWGWLAVTAVATALDTVYQPVAVHVFSSKYLPFFTWGIVFYRLWKGGADRLDAALFVTALASLLWMWSDRDWGVLGVILAMPVLFGLFVAGRLQWLAHPALLFFGRISFALYLLHFEIPIALMAILQAWSVPVLAGAVPAIAMVVGLATLQTYYWEEPAKNWLKTVYKTWAAGRTAGQA